jgi:hypothetical protein
VKRVGFEIGIGHRATHSEVQESDTDTRGSISAENSADKRADAAQAVSAKGCKTKEVFFFDRQGLTIWMSYARY